MRPFDLTAPATVEAALDSPGTFLAGGTTLVDLMKLNVLTPDHVTDINALPLRGIDTSDGLRIGALERMGDIARHPGVYPAISRALLLSASQQLRNMASIGGNLLQRTRCGYFRDVAGARTVRLADFYRLPGDTPEAENDLRPGELITEVVVPRLDWARRSTYVKVRDRQSYEFALCSAAVALDIRDARVADARVAVGGVATKPWRLESVEAALRGAPATPEAFEDAASAAAEGTRPLSGNAFKVSLLKRTVVRALIEGSR
jgi:xanthine dehydrogenase YagS FAD-binding subunit